MLASIFDVQHAHSIVVGSQSLRSEGWLVGSSS